MIKGGCPKKKLKEWYRMQKSSKLKITIIKLE